MIRLHSADQTAVIDTTWILTSAITLVQICYEYASFMGPAGLMREGFKEMYDSGHGCPDTDYSNLGYDATPGTANLATATALAHVARAIDVWDPEGAARKARPLSQSNTAGGHVMHSVSVLTLA